MAALLARCDLVVVTAEALRRAPIVASEALAARAPVLLSAAAETCGDVAPGVTGLVFESGAVAHLAGLIRSFLIDRTLLGRLQAAITAPPGFDGYLDGLLAAVRESVALERPEPALGQRLEPALGQRLEQALGQRPDRLPQTIGGSA
jgi:hypothetical protein